MNPYFKRLAVAFGASLGIHLIVFEVWAVTATLNLITSRVINEPEPPKEEVPVLTLLEPPPRDKPKMFVETDSSQETSASKKDSQFYSDRSTTAANPKPDPNKNDDKPNLDGKDSRVLSTENVPMPQPTTTPQPPAEPPTEAKATPDKKTTPPAEEKPAPALKPQERSVGPKKTEVSMLTKEPEKKLQEIKPKPDPAEAKLQPQQPERIIPEARSKSDSSVSREGIRAFEVTGTEYGPYDRKMFAAIKYRWLALIEQYTIPGERSGQVVLRYHQNDDGSVSELTIAENTAGDILALYCQKAITDSAPYGPWPPELKAMVKRNYREISVIFYY